VPSSSNQPYSAKRPRSLPVLTNQDPATVFSNWATQLNPNVTNAAPQPTPQNFSITNARGGLTLNWSPVLQSSGADGYEILKSPGGSFTDDLQVIPVKDPNQSTFFDGLGGTAKSASYRIRTTSGTPQNPQSARGPESGVLQHTSIDAADTVTKPTTVVDNWTSDKTRSVARLGNYGAIKLSSQTQSVKGRAANGLSGTSSGAAGSSPGSSSGSGTGAGGAGGGTGPTPPGGPTKPGTGGVGNVPFSSISSGVNNSATMTVGAGASIVPSSANPGVIDATELQGTPVSTTAPTSGEVLQLVGGTWQPAAIIAVGTQAGLQSVLPLGLGEIYVATDTGNLFIGTPGVGLGYLQVGDTSQVNETLIKILQELRAMKLAILSLDSTLLPQDYVPIEDTGSAYGYAGAGEQ
jgi:hypothetical protein